MSSVWEARYRLLVEQLDELADSLSGAGSTEPAVITDHTVRLLTTTVMLVQQHHVNRHGQCGYCGWTRGSRRFWRRRPRCTVVRAACFALGQGMDMVWRQLQERNPGYAPP